MKILFVTSVYPHALAPVSGIVNEYLAKAMAEHHEVRVVCPVSWTARWKRGRSRTPDVSADEHSSRLTTRYPTYYFPPKVLRSWYGEFLWWSIRAEILFAISEWRPDVIVGYWAHPDGEAAVRIARRLRVPVVIIVGGSDVLVITRDAMRRRAVLSVLSASDAVVAVSENLRQRVIDLGILATKVHAWSRGVDSRFCPGDRRAARARLGLPLDAPMAVWVGRMVPVKGLDVLLAAADHVRSRLPNFRLHLIGDGELRRNLAEHCRARGLDASVQFVGALSHDHLADWYRAADVTALSSWSEGLPNVLRESVACGTPFVSSDVGGIREIAGRNDRLFPAGDSDAMARALLGVLQRPRTSFALHNPTPRQQITWRDAADSLLALVASSRPQQQQARSNTRVIRGSTSGDGDSPRQQDVVREGKPIAATNVMSGG